MCTFSQIFTKLVWLNIFIFWIVSPTEQQSAPFHKNFKNHKYSSCGIVISELLVREK